MHIVWRCVVTITLGLCGCADRKVNRFHLDEHDTIIVGESRFPVKDEYSFPIAEHDKWKSEFQDCVRCMVGSNEPVVVSADSEAHSLAFCQVVAALCEMNVSVSVDLQDRKMNVMSGVPMSFPASRSYYVDNLCVSRFDAQGEASASGVVVVDDCAEEILLRCNVKTSMARVMSVLDACAGKGCQLVVLVNSLSEL